MIMHAGYIAGRHKAAGVQWFAMACGLHTGLVCGAAEPAVHNAAAMENCTEQWPISCGTAKANDKPGRAVFSNEEVALHRANI